MSARHSRFSPPSSINTQAGKSGGRVFGAQAPLSPTEPTVTPAVASGQPEMVSQVPVQASQPSQASQQAPSSQPTQHARGSTGSVSRALWSPYDPYAGPYPPELESAVRHEVRVQLSALEEEFARRIVALKLKHYERCSDDKADDEHENHADELRRGVDEYRARVKALKDAEQDICGELGVGIQDKLTSGL